ncbi:MAG: hypothetical protein BIFFINMI_00046 [Phycisphaerae bacterium]|nr:hypothetical protein [Phycisphaerae bacterium]
MKPQTAIAWTFAFLATAVAAEADDAPTSQPDARKAVVAVAPFASTFDDGTWGGQATDAFRLKLARWPLTEAVDRYSYDDLAAQAKVTIAWDTPAAKAAAFARDPLGADILIYGDVLKAGGHGEMTLRVRAIDLRAGPSLAVDRSFHITYPTQLRPAVEIVLNQLVGYSSVNMEVPALVKLTADQEARWTTAPNLVPDPGFDDATADGKSLARWECVLADRRYHPLRLDGSQAPIVADLTRQAVWADDPADARNRCLHMAINADVAGTYGVAVYSDWIPVTPGCIYRFAYRWRVAGPTPKVFIKGYALRPIGDELDAQGRAFRFQRREVYRRQVHPTSDADPKRKLEGGWTQTTADFVPRHDQYPPHWIRIDIYAYWPKGHAWFDDVVLRQLSDKPVVEQHDPADLPTTQPAGE